MKWFGRKQKDNIVSETKVLVSAVGADEKLASMADCDAAIYNKHYEDVTNTPVTDADSLIGIVKAGAFDLVHILANVNADGTMGRTRVDRVFRTCAKKDVRLVFFAAENPIEACSTDKAGSFSLAWMINRKGDNFPVFLDAMLSKMSSGTGWPQAYFDLEAPAGAPPEDFIIVPTCILSPYPGGVVLLGKRQPVALTAKEHTLLSQRVDTTSEFSVIMYGDRPCGPIFYREEDRRVNIHWECAGNRNRDISFGCVDLREWHEPKGVKIDKEHQLRILHMLRQWLRDQGFRSDIDLPLQVETEDRRCHWRDCRERKVTGSAYCPRHRDLNLLRE